MVDPRNTSSSPPSAETPLSDDDRRLLDFLRGRDVDCPLCRYNLRDLRTPVCPECERHLILTVGLQETPILPLIAVLIPPIFSGMCAPLLLVPIIVGLLRGAAPAPWFIVVIDVFGWISGLVGLLLVWQRQAFLRLTLNRQLLSVAVMWILHIAAFIFLLTGILGGL